MVQHLTAEEVAERLRVNVRVLHRWRNGKGIGPPCFRVGQRYLYPLAELEVWEARRILDMSGEAAAG